MALYAFDGTGNLDHDDDGKDTNVVRFSELYRPNGDRHVVYTSGVGTRKGPLGHVLGGLFGAGGRSRIDEMYDDLCARWAAGDHVIDIIGYSRGAALAIHFANRIADQGIQTSDGGRLHANIRFLGLFDTVASFGLSFNNILNFQDINLGWKVDRIPEIVEHAAHAMALDERREAFNLTRPAGQINEVWFRGVHGDIGGGNQNPNRFNIALHWMLDQARTAGLSFDDELIQDSKYSSIDVHAAVNENRDVVRDPPRQIRPDDAFHPSAQPKLAIGESVSVPVDSAVKHNFSGVSLEQGSKYRVTASGQWSDGKIGCNSAGWNTADELGWGKQQIVKTFEDNRRCPRANWFELVGSYGTEDEHLVRLGQAVNGIEFTADRTSDFWLFANDVHFKYDNNEGSIQVRIERLS
ncbi:MAG: DUF2235 domain-containing protein [Pseudomonadota bacterium]